MEESTQVTGRSAPLLSGSGMEGVEEKGVQGEVEDKVVCSSTSQSHHTCPVFLHPAGFSYPSLRPEAQPVVQSTHLSPPDPTVVLLVTRG